MPRLQGVALTRRICLYSQSNALHKAGADVIISRLLGYRLGERLLTFCTFGRSCRCMICNLAPVMRGYFATLDQARGTLFSHSTSYGY